MSLPKFAPFPDVTVRENIPAAEWTAYLDSWAALVELHLQLDDSQFLHAASEDDSSLSNFLASFFHELANDDSLASRTLQLRKKCFFALHRIYSGNYVPDKLLSWSFLSDISRAYSKSAQFRTLFEELWKRQSAKIEKSLQPAKNSLIKNLESRRPEEAEGTLNRIAPLLRVSMDVSTYMLTGSDFLDSLCNAYPNASPSLQSKLATVAYLGLTSLIEGTKPKFSMLSDHLYSLKANGEARSKTGGASLIADLVTNTSLLQKIREKATAPEATRVRNFAASLSSFQHSSVARPKKLVKRKVDKGKSKATGNEYTNAAFGEIHVHKMSMISQIQDLFPDLGAGFVVKLLHEYNDNIELVTAHLLEDSLPPHLANADRSEQLPSPTTTKPHFTPRPTPPLSPIPAPTTLSAHAPTFERRNVFDNDAFDRLAVSTSQLHIGRKNRDATADALLRDGTAATSKSAILSALAAFDSDDDERDDTYDAEDVGGTVDGAAPGGGAEEADAAAKNEEALFRVWSSAPELFARDSDTRRGKPRTALKTETGMTDEAIEGWATMLGRNPKRLRQLETRFSGVTAFSGQQNQIAATAWRATPAGSDAEGTGTEGEGQGQRGGRGGGRGGRGRGRGRGGGGRGGSVAGPADDKGTQVSRQRKEANKGSRANHNRRDQRAKKMARGGLPG